MTPWTRATAPSMDGGDFAIDGVGGGAGEGGVDGEDRLVDLRQLAHLDAEERGEAADDDQGVDDDRQHRPAHEETGEARALRVFLLLERTPCDQPPGERCGGRARRADGRLAADSCGRGAASGLRSAGCCRRRRHRSARFQPWRWPAGAGHAACRPPEWRQCRLAAACRAGPAPLSSRRTVAPLGELQHALGHDAVARLHVALDQHAVGVALDDVDHALLDLVVDDLPDIGALVGPLDRERIDRREGFTRERHVDRERHSRLDDRHPDWEWSPGSAACGCRDRSCCRWR